MKFFLQAIVCSSDVFFRCPGWLNRPNFPRKIEAPSNGLLPFMEQRQSWSWNSWKAWYQWPQRHYAPFFLHQQVWLQLENKQIDVLECGTCPTSCSTCRDHPWWCQAGSSFEVASSGKDLYFWVFEYELANIAGMHIGGIGALTLSSMKRMSTHERVWWPAHVLSLSLRLAEQVASGWGFLELFCQ